MYLTQELELNFLHLGNNKKKLTVHVMIDFADWVRCSRMMVFTEVQRMKQP